MPYFQSTDGLLHFLSDEDVANGWAELLPAGSQAITDEKAQALQNPLPSTAELAIIARLKRDELITETDYLVMPDYPISATRLDAVKAYRQALRDIPEGSGFPQKIVWPDFPA